MSILLSPTFTVLNLGVHPKSWSIYIVFFLHFKKAFFNISTMGISVSDCCLNANSIYVHRDIVSSQRATVHVTCCALSSARSRSKRLPIVSWTSTRQSAYRSSFDDLLTARSENPRTSSTYLTATVTINVVA